MSRWLTDAMIAGKVIKTTCPRCDGNVTVPTEVVYVEYRDKYLPAAHCHRCGVDFYWLPPTSAWYADRVMDAPPPTIVEE
jgi:hypothetical protein